MCPRPLFQFQCKFSVDVQPGMPGMGSTLYRPIGLRTTISFISELPRLF